ncbi:MAG: acyl-CoA dehydrogenase [Limnohabitans sp.]|nr:acyl-CoA dehydrogenase [Limnohabitans sp.]
MSPVRAMSATLDHEDAEPLDGDVLPPLWHWLYFLPVARHSEIGPDGHPKRGGFLPPMPLPRRMWAGGRLRWHRPLQLGDEVQRVSSIERVQHKTGRSGELLFVQVLHRYSNGHGLCLEETHDIVYRPAPDATAAPAPGLKPVHQAVWQRNIVPDDVLLFRYSALTFNSHRIHYDRRYVTQVEGYPGLIVHGPLMATLLVDLLRRHSPRFLQSFEFKAVKPVFECADRRVLSVCAQPDGEQVHAWVQDHLGDVCMQATAHWKP